MTRTQYPSAREADEALARIYARPELADRGAPSWVQPIADAAEAIREAIAGFIQAAIESIGVGGSRLAVWLIVGASLLVVLWVVSRLIHEQRVGRRARSSGRAGGAPATAMHDAGYWDAAVERAMADGRFRDAAFACYHAMVLRLDERGALRFDAAKTPGDYRREVAREADASRVLNGFLRLFEPLAWGRHGEDADTLERLRAVAAEARGRG